VTAEIRTLLDLAEPDGLFVDGDWVESKDQDPEGEVRLIQLADIGDGLFRDRSNRYLTAQKAKDLGCTYLTPEDILIARMPEPLGRACTFPDVGQPAITAVDVCIFRPGPDVLGRYVMHMINAPQFRARVHSLQSGTTRKRISRRNLATIEIPIPSYDAQREIVEEIEKQFTRLEGGVINLKQARLRLATYRSAVLESVLEDVTGDLPKGWRWRTPKEIAKDEKYSLAIGPFGSNLKVSDYTEEGVPLVFVRHIRSGDFDLSTPFITPEKAASLKAHQVQPGDVLVTKMGDPPGDACVYPLDRPTAVMTADCIKLAPDDEIVDPRFLAYVIPSKAVRRQVLAVTQGVAQKKMSLGRFSGIRIPIPPRQEQDAILSHLDNQMSLVARMEWQIVRDLQMAERVRESLLSRAFSGRLLVGMAA
jgi:type I restriction enzyme, S subunit